MRVRFHGGHSAVREVGQLLILLKGRFLVAVVVQDLRHLLEEHARPLDGVKDLFTEHHGIPHAADTNEDVPELLAMLLS